MSQSQLRPQARQQAAPSNAPRGTDIVATVQHLIFDPGLYTLHIGAPTSSNTDMGVKLPCVRLETIPPTQNRPGRANIVNTRESGWLSPSPEPSFVLVTGGQAGAILTVYRANDGMAPPEVRFTHVFVGGRPEDASAPRPASNVAATQTGRLSLLAHVSGVGDVADPGGNWVGRPGGGMAVEGFSITPGPDITPDGIEYQAILGSNWNTPWFKGGDYCGSRGLMLPLLGFRVQIKGKAAEEFDLQYFGQFIGGKTVGPIKNGEACAASDSPLEALRVVLVPKSEMKAPPPAAEAPPMPDCPAPAAKNSARAPIAKKPAPMPTAKPARGPAPKAPALAKPRAR